MEELHPVYVAAEGGEPMFYLDRDGLARDEAGQRITLRGVDLPDTLYMDGLPCRLLVNFLPGGGEARWVEARR